MIMTGVALSTESRPRHAILDCVESRDSTDDVDTGRDDDNNAQARTNHVLAKEARDEAPDADEEACSERDLPVSTGVPFLQGRDEPSRDRDGVQEEHHGHGSMREDSSAASMFLPSPIQPYQRRTTGMPETSFLHSPSTPTTDHTMGRQEADDASSSFHLFNHSFDDGMNEEAGDGDWQHPPQLYYHPTLEHTAPPSWRTPTKGNPNSDISLPALEYADLSPIKLEDAELEQRRGHRRSPALLSEPIAFSATPSPSLPPPELNNNNSIQFYSSGGVSNPLFVLRSSRRAFANCTFLLSCLRHPEHPCAVNMNEQPYGSVDHYQGRSNQAYHNIMSDPIVVAMAVRRVEASICAFGGTVTKPTASIFRKNETLYEQVLHKRFFVSATHVSWALEENPPVQLSTAATPRLIDSHTSDTSDKSRGGASQDALKSPPSFSHLQVAPRSDETGRSTPSPTPSELAMTSLEPPKMKYRCKLCGQPKQNHNCPYRRSIQRSIGVLVQKAVNSFSAYEPGEITPALSEMNNFVSYDSADRDESDSPVLAGIYTKVCPETFGTTGVLQSPQGSLSTHGPTPVTTPNAMNDEGDNRKRSRSDMESNLASPKILPAGFANMVPLRPEQYRAVSPGKLQQPGAFQYPPVPLTLAERRSLSDTLFELSRQIPGITEECSAILYDARIRGLWDMAVAELLTQIVVGLFCYEGDGRLEGLHHYLLGIGISC